METQQIQRQIAYKMWFSNLSNGNFVQGSKSPDGFSPSYVELNNKRISRVNVIATVVDIFKSEDGNYFSFTLDDGTATMRIKAFNEDTNALLNIEKGDMVLVVGRLREYQGEIYISPEITRKIMDPNEELVRKSELLKNIGRPEEFKHQKNMQTVQAIIKETPREPAHEELRQRVIDFLSEDEESGIETSAIAKKIQKDDTTAEAVIKELILEGEIYENKPGHYKII
ncbi:MAG: OB-fold nucleic acid binding domain-containing protein [Nanoarchaeota archaeon]|nr:OB-fold nucleic acid binding domain-containing protein [Nanoarchaeota archaeon]